MSLTTVATLRLTLGVGTLYSDPILQEVCDASDTVLLPMLWSNYKFNSSQSNTTTEGVLYFTDSITGDFYVGQIVAITGNGSPHDGSKTLTGVSTNSITYAVTGTPAAVLSHTVIPYGQVAGTTSVAWGLDAAILEASLMLAVDIFQARQVPSSGGVAIDGSSSPWRMSNSLLAKVRGLIAHALDPRSMVG